MLDIETFGVGPHPCIVQIGACYFDRRTGEIGATFKRNICPESSVALGGVIDASTVDWWLRQSPEAIASVTALPRDTLPDALHAFNTFVYKAEVIWSHATFDFATMMHTYRLVGIKPGFSYRAARDIRTLTDLAQTGVKDTERTGVHHDGLDDCLHQVKYCVKAFNALLANAVLAT